MAKVLPNAPCPCGGGKYKRCCGRYHAGRQPPDALALMRSRYSAYAAGDAAYILRTMHPDHPEARGGASEQAARVIAFCRGTKFCGLTILHSVPGADEAWVSFHAQLRQGDVDVSFTERSYFVREEGRWLYRAGER